MTYTWYLSYTSFHIQIVPIGIPMFPVRALLIISVSSSLKGDALGRGRRERGTCGPGAQGRAWGSTRATCPLPCHHLRRQLRRHRHHRHPHLPTSSRATSGTSAAIPNTTTPLPSPPLTPPPPPSPPPRRRNNHNHHHLRPLAPRPRRPRPHSCCCGGPRCVRLCVAWCAEGRGRFLRLAGAQGGAFVAYVE